MRNPRALLRRSALAAFLAAASAAIPASAGVLPDSTKFSAGEVVAAGHRFFGKTSGGLASAVERVVAERGLPAGYIIGEEASGALVGGLRYGEGTLHTSYGGSRRVFWQGPSIGGDVGGDGNRTMMLIYDLPGEEAIFRRFVGVDGSAYLIGGAGVTVLVNRREEVPITVVPIRTGMGARLGLNVGYLKFTPEPTWNPF